MKAPWSRRVEFSDACMSGIGRADSHMPDATVQAIAAATEVKGGCTNLGLEHSVPVDSKGR
eukprot:10661018-Karenia_brevis.AAC.1